MENQEKVKLVKVRINDDAGVACEPFNVAATPGSTVELPADKAKQIIDAGKGVEVKG